MLWLNREVMHRGSCETPPARSRPWSGNAQPRPSTQHLHSVIGPSTPQSYCSAVTLRANRDFYGLPRCHGHYILPVKDISSLTHCSKPTPHCLSHCENLQLSVSSVGGETCFHYRVTVAVSLCPC